MWALYMVALFWTTTQAYIRLASGRADYIEPTVIHIPSSDKQ